MNPFSGTWIANIEKSRHHTNHQFQSATLTFEISGDDVSARTPPAMHNLRKRTMTSLLSLTTLARNISSLDRFTLNGVRQARAIL